MYWTLELASKLEDAPWPATKDELIMPCVRVLRLRLLRTCRKWKMKARFMKVLKIFGLIIPAKKISSSTKRSIDAL